MQPVSLLQLPFSLHMHLWLHLTPYVPIVQSKGRGEWEGKGEWSVRENFIAYNYLDTLALLRGCQCQRLCRDRQQVPCTSAQ